ncbi:MAG: sulfur carrier protein ThiS [Candidatus Hydrogenedentota bacterium]
MTLTVNGESRELTDDTTLIGLLNSFSLNPDATAVQLNEDILEREAFPTTTLNDGDTLELIRIVGGG